MGIFRRDEIADLTHSADVTFALLTDGSWKTRAVEEITIGSALSVESRRSFQCADVGDVLGDLRPRRATQASLVLPVTTLPKRPLLGFDVSVPDRTVAYLPPRGALGDLEARYVLALACTGGILLDDDLRTLIIKICEFSPGRWSRLDDADDVRRLRQYVEGLTGWSLSTALVTSWLETLAPAAETLSSAIGLPYEISSSAENPALVVPLLHHALGIGPDDVLGLLTRYTRFVTRSAAREWAGTFPPHAVLAEYGRRWEVMIECTVPLDGPFIVRLSERRPLHVTRSGYVDLDVTTGDAVSNHTVIRVTDENVRIRQRQLGAFSVDGASVPEDEFDSVRLTHEEIAVYAADPSREYRLRLRLQLEAAPHVMFTTALIAVLTVLSVALVVRRWTSLDNGDLAVIVIPTTFAASLAVTRERTTLATRLTSPWRTVVLVATAMLWILVAVLYLGDTQVSEPRCPTKRVTPTMLATTQDLPDDHARRCDGQEHR